MCIRDRISGCNTANLVWQFPYSDLDGFEIDRKITESGTWTNIASVSGDARNYLDSAFDIFQPVYYRIRALHQGFISENTEINYLTDDNLIFIEGSTFQMGDNWGNGEADESPVHTVVIGDYWMSKTEITFAQYNEYCQATGSPVPADGGWGQNERPVINVSWLDAVKYCNWLSENQGFAPVYAITGEIVTQDWNAMGYCLPSEAEWEFAARGGISSGNHEFSGSDLATDVAVISKTQTENTASLTANELGLHDMSGNVWEWCWDYYDLNYYTECNNQGTVNDPLGPNDGNWHVVKGGSFNHDQNYCRIPNRSGFDLAYKSITTGFGFIRRRR